MASQTTENNFSLREQMCVMARKAATALFRVEENGNNEEDEISKANQIPEGNETLPLNIPPPTNNANIPLTDLNISSSAAFSEMSVDTSMASSMVKSVASSFASMFSSSAAPTKFEDIEELPIISLNEVKDHYDSSDAWVVIYDRVYDVTSFIHEHPGGAYILEEHLGFDATVAFRSTGHSTDAFSMLDQYLIGILPKNERVYDNRLRW